MPDVREPSDGSPDWPPSEANGAGEFRVPFVPEPTSDAVPSPYPPADVLSTYTALDTGLITRILDRIDAETRQRHAVELDLIARNERRLDRAQRNAFAVAMTGTAGALVAGYLGVPSLLCVAVVAFCVGGPNTATVLARVLDRRQG